MSNQLATQQSQLATPLKKTLLSKGMQEQFKLALPRHLSVDRFCRVALTALTRTPKLAECTEASFFRCLLDLSAMGIEPDQRRAYLIPFENRRAGSVECTLIVGYQGYVELVKRSGTVATIHADIVCENDDFAYDKGEIIRHKINFREPRGEMYAAYALVRDKDGTEQVEVLPRHEIEKVRDNSQGYKAALKYKKGHPWMDHFEEMSKKTAFRRLVKWLVLSPEIREALDRDSDDFEPSREERQASGREVPEAQLPTGFFDRPSEPESTEQNAPQSENESPERSQKTSQDAGAAERNDLLKQLSDLIEKHDMTPGKIDQAIDALEMAQEGIPNLKTAMTDTAKLKVIVNGFEDLVSAL